MVVLLLIGDVGKVIAQDGSAEDDNDNDAPAALVVVDRAETGSWTD